MDKRSEKAFGAIKEFIKVLYEVFGKHNKPLALYNKLIENTETKHVVPATRHVGCFDSYIRKYRKTIMGGRLNLPQNAKIIYNERIFIDLPAFLKKCDVETADVIKQHLLVITSLLHPEDEESLHSLEEKMGTLGLDTSTKEGQFLNNMFGQVSESMAGVDVSNPMQAVTSLMGSGLIQNMMGGLSNGLQNGEMDMGKLMGTMQSLMGNLTGQMKEMGMEMPDISQMEVPDLSVGAEVNVKTTEIHATIPPKDIVLPDVPEEEPKILEIPPDEITEDRDE